MDKFPDINLPKTPTALSLFAITALSVVLQGCGDGSYPPKDGLKQRRESPILDKNEKKEPKKKSSEGGSFDFAEHVRTSPEIA